MTIPIANPSAMPNQSDFTRMKKRVEAGELDYINYCHDTGHYEPSISRPQIFENFQDVPQILWRGDPGPYNYVDCKAIVIGNDKNSSTLPSLLVFNANGDISRFYTAFVAPRKPSIQPYELSYSIDCEPLREDCDHER